MMQGLPLLSLAIWAPIIAGVAVLLTGGDRNAHAARVIALIGALIGFAVTIPLYTGFDLQQGGFQFVEMRTGSTRLTPTTISASTVFRCC